MTKRERFLKACHCQDVDRPPIWLMRQAGRVLPEYRALKEKHNFLELAQTPELAAEVTLQPIRRFDFDAAILFSDILVIPEALGQPYQFRESGGVQMAYPIRSLGDLGKLNWQGVPERLQYVAQALRLLRAELSGATALIGFAGSPWTLANFMVEGGSAVSFRRAQEWLAAEPKCFYQFLEKLTAALIDYLRMQIDAGVDALQIFDTLGGLLDEQNFAEASARWMGDIVRALGNRVPVIVFSRRPLASIATLTQTNARVLSFDGAVALREVRQRLPIHIGIQGNLTPALMEGSPDAMVAAAVQILEDMQRRKGFIFNLGHGLPPKAPIENVKILVETVKKFAWQN